MGHRFSKPICKDKSPSDDNNTAIIEIHNKIDINQSNDNNQLGKDNKFITKNQNLQQFTTSTYPMNNINSTASTTTSSSIGQQFIIKIQLTKMEKDSPSNLEIINKNETNINNINHSSLRVGGSSNSSCHTNNIHIKSNDNSDMNLITVQTTISNREYQNNNNSKNNNQCIANSSINNFSTLNTNSNNKILKSRPNSDSNSIQGNSNNNAILINDLSSQLDKCNLEINNEDDIQNVPLPDYQVMNAVNNKKQIQNITGTTESLENSEKVVCDKKQHCSRRKKLLSSSAYPLSKRKCCKCSCRDNIAKKNSETILDSNKKSLNNEQQKLSSTKNSSEKSWASRFTAGLKSKSESKGNSSQKNQFNNNQKNALINTTTTTSNNSITSTTANNSAAVMVVRPQCTNSVPLIGERFTNQTGTNQLAIWADNQMLVVQIPQASQLVLERFENIDEHGNRIQTTSRADVETQSDFNDCTNNVGPNQWPPLISGIKFTTPIGPKVHSQEDFIHCLVPDLEKITASSFYWGKMDRYEAERLLDGKPEGTFLLRDSAQEEYLFSVTFRKYDRSLHARIEQLNHKFSFDCHDPGVFTAPTVTDLLEHYKDPTCVMFFEPMLTIPLNRNFPFSLQQLCRAKIVSNISYDGINELQLPNSLKSYLKEYHYKLRVRVKPFDETFYTCS